MCRRLKTSELIRSNSNAWTEVDAEASLARFPIFAAAACSDSASTRRARIRRPHCSVGYTSRRYSFESLTWRPPCEHSTGVSRQRCWRYPAAPTRKRDFSIGRLRSVAHHTATRSTYHLTIRLHVAGRSFCISTVLGAQVMTACSKPTTRLPMCCVRSGKHFPQSSFLLKHRRDPLFGNLMSKRWCSLNLRAQ